MYVWNYKSFGKMVTFDTSYKTNKYNLSLGMFCVNHHKSSVIYATAFLFKEDIESFVQVFKTLFGVHGATSTHNYYRLGCRHEGSNEPGIS